MLLPHRPFFTDHYTAAYVTRSWGSLCFFSPNTPIFIQDQIKNDTMSIKIPEGYNHVMPYLIVKDAAGVIRFMTEVLGARETTRHMREDGQTVMHAEVAIGSSTIMLAGSTGEYPPDTAGMFVYVPDADAAYQRALAHGAISILEPRDQPYGRSGGVKDPYGNTWWITTHTGE